LPQLLPGQDPQVSKKLQVLFSKRGIEVFTGADLSNFNRQNYSFVLVSIGRRANIGGLGLEKLGVGLKEGKIAVDEYLKTSIDNIYAAGDCASRIMLAHYAAYQGNCAVENMVSGNRCKADNPNVPACVFTEPQVASVGLSEEQALNIGLKINVHKFDFKASAMARIFDESDGFIKAISSQ